MPRILITLPGSSKEHGLRDRTTGHRNRISPPPLGGAPRLLICKQHDSLTMREKQAALAKRGANLQFEILLNAEMLEKRQRYRSEHIHLSSIHDAFSPARTIAMPVEGTEISRSSLVIPLSVTLKGFLAKGARHANPSR